MRYSFTALVLATAAIGQVAAGPVGHSHAHLHKKHAALVETAEAEKREAQPVDWDTAVDWSKVSYTYSAGQTWGQPTAAPVASAASDAASSVAAAVGAVETKAASVASGVSSAVSSAASSVASSIEEATGELLTAVSETLLKDLGCLLGTNSKSSDGNVWIGSDGPYTNTFVNSADEDVVVVIWEGATSWVNVNAPAVTIDLPSGKSKTVSFASGVSGAWAAIYEDTSLVNGQVSNTWGEYTFSEEGVVDVSREVNMDGHTMEIVGPKCTTNMSTCVFVCDSGTSCETGYSLLNCANGSQDGANYGTFAGADSGGCGGLGSSASLTTTFS